MKNLSMMDEMSSWSSSPYLDEVEEEGHRSQYSNSSLEGRQHAFHQYLARTLNAATSVEAPVCIDNTLYILPFQVCFDIPEIMCDHTIAFA